MTVQAVADSDVNKTFFVKTKTKTSIFFQDQDQDFFFQDQDKTLPRPQNRLPYIIMVTK